jgi:hypothetical protein
VDPFVFGINLEALGFPKPECTISLEKDMHKLGVASQNRNNTEERKARKLRDGAS